MKVYRYIYKGSETVHLPAQGILAIGNDAITIYETTIPVNHPDFEEIKETRKEK